MKDFMLIGEALKETRKSLNLSQTEMAGNILTKSYYSKIERGIHEINANDLLEILALHQINLNDFFSKVSNQEKEIDKEKWVSKLRQSFYHHDEREIGRLKKELESVKADQYTIKILSAIIELLEIGIDGNLDDLSQDRRTYIKSIIFETEDWNEDNLRLFSLCLSIWNVEERESIIESILQKYRKIENYPQIYQDLVSAILVNYLSYSIRSSTENLKLVDEIIKLLNRLPTVPNNCWGKIMASFYGAYFKDEQKKMESILTFFEHNNMSEFANILKVSI